MHGPQSTMQDLHSITAWVDENCMNLNPKTCKEMRISYRAENLDVPQLTVNETYLEKVERTQTKYLVSLFVAT